MMNNSVPPCFKIHISLETVLTHIAPMYNYFKNLIFFIIIEKISNSET